MKKTFFLLLISIFIISCESNNTSSSNICDPNPCLENNIPNKTTCKPIENTSFTCECESGYTLDVGTKLCVHPVVDPCDPNPCTAPNKTICISVGETDSLYPECICEKDYEESETGECVKISEVNIRAVAANISTGEDQNYDAGEGIRILQGLKPNVIMIQEFNYKSNSDLDYTEMVEAIFQDSGCLSSIPKRCFYEVGTGALIPNGIISKFPIISSGEWADPASNIDATRRLNYAIIDIPKEKDLFVVSVHLSAKSYDDQIAAAQLIAQKVSELKKENPNKYYYMVGGDFNGSDVVSKYGFGEYETEAIFDADEYAPRPIGEDGNYGTNTNRTKPYDWILTSSDLSAYQVSSNFCSVTNSTDCKRYTNGLVFDTRDFSQLNLDKYFFGTSFNEQTLNINDSGALNMQHMAIIKDFKITF